MPNISVEARLRPSPSRQKGRCQHNSGLMPLKNSRSVQCRELSYAGDETGRSGLHIAERQLSGALRSESGRRL